MIGAVPFFFFVHGGFVFAFAEARGNIYFPSAHNFSKSTRQGRLIYDRTISSIFIFVSYKTNNLG